MTGIGQIIYTEKIGNLSIPLANNNIIKLHNVVLAPDSHSNPISLGQLHESEIKYLNNTTAKTMIKNGEIIALMKREQNPFMLNLTFPSRVMATISSRVIAKIGQK